MAEPASSAAAENDRPLLELSIGNPAHGGHFVARHEGRVIFVRHALPGERVLARVTDGGAGSGFWRADTVEVLEPSAHRVAHPWQPADALLAAADGRAAVGGAEFGHIELAEQRRIKAAVFAEQLQRLAGVRREVEVEPAREEHAGGLGWRTRAGFAVDAAGRLAMHAHRSGELVPVQQMPLAVDAINALTLWDTDLAGVARVEVAAPANGSTPLVLLIPQPGTPPQRLPAVAAAIGQDRAVSVAAWEPEQGRLTRLRGRTWVQESCGVHQYRVTGEGFWQIHRQAPAILAAAVLEGIRPQPGDHVADLYAGAGLFSAPLAAAVGEGGRVLSVEGSPGTSRDARKNLHDAPQVDIVQGKVDRVLRAEFPQRRGTPGRQVRRGLDAVVLDPPRAGAGKTVVRQLDELRPRVVGYVSCDPASFARDLGYFLALGWELETLRVFDLYPHTHHMETFGLLVRA
ncbi:class I SAM-dependent RNA methyltransferase [Arthrobacter mobilis]|uniref:Class I SAM-dependent RNA methyltransferase n=1 Tax=Arthrobacter mobilis TaxID=2724944 RepID=A0A7X6HF63_9MICC|nr:class I SAM-dependent RNA methyltransferase [Arthrobacter mobilis]NKX54876.1 class I SAM-dependent RNA methyltransferase [Arthrobacter mobilis]